MTQTEAPAHPPDEYHGSLPPVDDHHDPLHDIDGMKTTVAVVGTLVMIVFLIWAMTHLFNVMVRVERQKKIADVPTTEINEIRADMAKELSGQHGTRGKMTIEAAMEAYRKNPGWRPK